MASRRILVYPHGTINPFRYWPGNNVQALIHFQRHSSVGFSDTSASLQFQAIRTLIQDESGIANDLKIAATPGFVMGSLSASPDPMIIAETV